MSHRQRSLTLRVRIDTYAHIDGYEDDSAIEGGTAARGTVDKNVALHFGQVQKSSMLLGNPHYEHISG